MTTPIGLREFFTVEAGEYLERLALLTGGTGVPDSERMVHFARALRGAALMAGPPGYAVAASAIEMVAKATRDGNAAWTEEVAGRMTQAVEDCKALLRRVREWSDVDVQRCDQIAERLDGLIGTVGKKSMAAVSTPSGGLSAAARAYVAREAAAVAGTLEQVAEAVEHRPAANSADPLVHRLQPLRGLGALPALSPLPELLETLDLTVAFASKGGAWPPGAGRAFRATGAALARMARDIAELGIPQNDSHEIVHAAELLRETFAREDDVVPISSLLAPGDPTGIARLGSAPPRPAVPSGIGMELMSLADRIRHAAAQVKETRSRAARGLSLNTLGLSVRGLTSSLGVQGATRTFLNRIERETMSGRALLAGDRFADLLEAAARDIATAARAESVAGLESALAPLVDELDLMAGAVPGALDQLEIIPIDSLAPDDADVVPVEALFYDAAPVAVPGYTPFEQTFSTWFRLERAATAEDEIVSIASLAPDDLVVSISDLLYRGRRALERADVVRRELDTALKARRDLTSMEFLLSELLALVPLALDDDR